MHSTCSDLVRQGRTLAIPPSPWLDLFSKYIFRVDLSDLKTKIDKIVITPVAANAKKIKEVRDKIAALFDDTYTSANGDFIMSGPRDIDEYDLLMAELNELKANAGNDNIQTETPDQLTFTHYTLIHRLLSPLLSLIV